MHVCVCVDSAFVDDVCGCFFMLCFNSAFIVAFMVVCCMGCLFLLFMQVCFVSLVLGVHCVCV